MFETRSGVFLVAGLMFFALAFVVMGLLPWTIYRNVPEETVSQMIEKHGIVPEFVELAEKVPAKFKEYYGDCDASSFEAALRRGHEVYVGEACWHCHSQFVRPVSNEALRWGPVAHAREYQNELQRPVLFGTRRVGPDLSREAARRSNDWHIAHFHKPTSVVPVSVMPEYAWFFDSDGYPNRDGMAIITYVQWLGSWIEEYPYYQGEGPSGTGEIEKDKLDLSGI
ncbi:MAG: cbb3-type cytochrome c oxidase subunit II [Candidatus Hydrogenedentes bacterium]|nr:cbb3-type cytochrome c oxidase subunit II [Candidatus Hydrogenedentota bacterium]